MILYHTGKVEIRTPAQIAIKTEKAAKQLHFIKSQKIEGITGEALKKEQDANQEIFARELNKILNA